MRSQVIRVYYPTQIELTEDLICDFSVEAEVEIEEEVYGTDADGRRGVGRKIASWVLFRRAFLQVPGRGFLVLNGEEEIRQFLTQSEITSLTDSLMDEAFVEMEKGVEADL